MSDESQHGLRVLRDATCTYCCCMCDDIELHVEQNRIVRAQNACTLGRAWFEAERPTGGPACLIQGQPAPLAAGIQRAAQILRSARNPLVYGLTEAAAEAQRRAVGIADWLGATLDTATSTQHAPSILAFQRVGKTTCTLGETRNRSDLILFWGTNVAETHPRFFSKYSAEAQGLFVPRGRADRTCVLIDVARNATAEKVDLFFQIKPGSDLEVLWTLRALAKGLTLDAALVEQQTGVPLQRWADLMERMKRARYGAFCFGNGLIRSRGEHANCEGLFTLTREMNAHTRFVARSIRGRGNVTGADRVTAWRTGFPFAVNFSRGYPRYSPGEYTAQELLGRGEVDAALVVGSDPLSTLAASAVKQLRQIPLVVIGSRATPTRAAAQIAFPTSTYGIHSPGTVYRMDDVPLPLRPALDSKLPSEVEVLSQLEAEIRATAPA